MKIEYWTLRQWHWLFLVGIVLVVLVHTMDLLIGRPFWIVTRATYLGHENNIPTWFSGGILFAAGGYAFYCYKMAAIRQIRPRWGWLLLAVMMIVLSCDEVASIHESVGDLLLQKVAPDMADQMKHSAWPLVLGPVAMVVAGAIIWILHSHLKGAYGAAKWLLAGVIVYLGAAVGLETTINWLNHEELQWLWDIQIIVEEGGELLGAWLIGMGLIARCEGYARIVQPSFINETAPQVATPAQDQRSVIA